jgi:hypothetical protein
MARGASKSEDEVEDKEPGEISEDALELLDEKEELADELGLTEEVEDDKGWE